MLITEHRFIYSWRRRVFAPTKQGDGRNYLQPCGDSAFGENSAKVMSSDVKLFQFESQFQGNKKEDFRKVLNPSVLR